LIGAVLLVAGLTAVVLAVGQRAPGAPPPRVSAQRAPAARPNIVFVLTDDLTWDLVPYMPHVRRLQRDGMTFRQFLVSDSLCCSSRATIFTGEFPHNTRVLGNEAPTGGYEAFRRAGDAERSVAVALQRAGYRTALWGKYLHEYQPIATGRDPGWDEWFAISGAYRGFGYRASDNGFPRYVGYRPRNYVTAVLLRRAIQFIRANAGDRPFFAMVSTFAPHKPAIPRRGTAAGSATCRSRARWGTTRRTPSRPGGSAGVRP
jgi:arylsulfatase A-like enzyme